MKETWNIQNLSCQKTIQMWQINISLQSIRFMWIFDYHALLILLKVSKNFLLVSLKLFGENWLLNSISTFYVTY